MLPFDQELPESRTPVLVIQGRRDSGKSDWIARLLETSPGLSVGVITNEAAGVPRAAVDGEKVEGAFVPHAVGCLCCVARSGLVDAMRRLHARRSAANARLDLVIIETAEAADPAPVLQTLLNNALVTHYFRLDGVVQVLSAADEPAPVALTGPTSKQLAVADRIVVLSDDTSSRRPGSMDLLSAINPSARVLADHEATLPALTGAGARDEFSRTGRLDTWLCSAEGDASAVGYNLFRFQARLAGDTSWEAFHGWMNAGLQLHGDVIYRLRAVLSIEGETRPVVLQGVQHVMEPPSRLHSWGSMDRCSKLHFITSELPADVVRSSLARDLPVFAASAAQREFRRQRARLDPSLPA